VIDIISRIRWSARRHSPDTIRSSCRPGSFLLKSSSAAGRLSRSRDGRLTMKVQLETSRRREIKRLQRCINDRFSRLALLPCECANPVTSFIRCSTPLLLRLDLDFVVCGLTDLVDPRLRDVKVDQSHEQSARTDVPAAIALRVALIAGWDMTPKKRYLQERITLEVEEFHSVLASRCRVNLVS